MPPPDPDPAAPAAVKKSSIGVVFTEPKFDWDAKNLFQEWRRFYEECTSIFETFYCELEEIDQVGCLKTWMGGTPCLNAMKTMTFDPADSRFVLKTIDTKFTEKWKPVKDTISHRFDFTRAKSMPHETMDAWLQRLKLQIEDCAFPAEMKEEMLKLQFISGCEFKKARDQMLKEAKDDTTIEGLLTITRKVEAHEFLLKKAAGNDVETADIRSRTRQRSGSRGPQQNDKRSQSGGARRQWKHRTPSGPRNGPSQFQGKCRKCDQNHPWGECPAHGKQCHICNGNNHYAKCCFKKESGNQAPGSQRGAYRGKRGGSRGGGHFRGKGKGKYGKNKSASEVDKEDEACGGRDQDSDSVTVQKLPYNDLVFRDQDSDEFTTEKVAFDEMREAVTDKTARRNLNISQVKHDTLYADMRASHIRNSVIRFRLDT
jgi:hypothetical protein